MINWSPRRKQGAAKVNIIYTKVFLQAIFSALGGNGDRSFTVAGILCLSSMPILQLSPEEGRTESPKARPEAGKSGRKITDLRIFQTCGLPDFQTVLKGRSIEEKRWYYLPTFGLF